MAVNTTVAAVNTAKDTTVAAVNTAKDTTVAAVDTAKDATVAAVDTAKDTTVAAVDTAKDTTVAAIAAVDTAVKQLHDDVQELGDDIKEVLANLPAVATSMLAGVPEPLMDKKSSRTSRTETNNSEMLGLTAQSLLQTLQATKEVKLLAKALLQKEPTAALRNIQGIITPTIKMLESKDIVQMNAALLLIANFSQAIGMPFRFINGRLAESVKGVVIEDVALPDGVRALAAHVYKCMAVYAPARSMLTLLLDMEPATFAAIKGLHNRATLVAALAALLEQSPIIFAGLSQDRVRLFAGKVKPLLAALLSDKDEAMVPAALAAFAALADNHSDLAAEVAEVAVKKFKGLGKTLKEIIKAAKSSGATDEEAAEMQKEVTIEVAQALKSSIGVDSGELMKLLTEIKGSVAKLAARPVAPAAPLVPPPLPSVRAPSSPPKAKGPGAPPSEDATLKDKLMFELKTKLAQRQLGAPPPPSPAYVQPAAKKEADLELKEAMEKAMTSRAPRGGSNNSQAFPRGSLLPSPLLPPYYPPSLLA